MTGKPSLTIEQLLERYARYDHARLHTHHLPHPSRSGFAEGADGLHMTRQTLRNYEAHTNLPWPLLPEDENVLVYCVFGRPPFELTWARGSVARALQLPLEAIVGKPVLDVLRQGEPWPPAETRQARACGISKFDTWLGVAGRLRQPVGMTVRYTGPHTERFVCYAEPVGEPYATELFNVQPDIIIQMKQVDLRAHAQQLVTHSRQLEQYLNQVLPYQYPFGD